MKTGHLDRIRHALLREHVTGAQDAACWIEDGMTVDHTEHDVDVTEPGLADLRGLAPHVLEQACAWHTRYRETGSMRPD